MKRTAFKRKGYEPRPAKQTDYSPRPREVVRSRSSGQEVCTPVKKFEYVRDARLRLMCRSMACQHCGKDGPEAGVTWAHSNQGRHGKGKSVKASDIFVAAMCWTCHSELDQGSRWTQDERVVVWETAHRRTVERALRERLWPVGVPLPPGYGEPELPIEDGVYLSTVRDHGGWMSARDVAEKHGTGWHPVSFALRRLVESGMLEEDVVEQAGTARSVEHQRVYRARPQTGWVRRVETTLPGWLAPQAVAAVGVARRVMGAAGMQRWAQDQLGGPGGPLKGAARTKSAEADDVDGSPALVGG